MDEEVLIPQVRLIWDPCESASSLRIITHQEPCCVSVLGRTGQSLPPFSFPKILYPKQLSRRRPAAIVHCSSWPASWHTAQGIPGKAVPGGWHCGHAHTHTCSHVHNPTCPADFDLAAALEGNVKENSLKWNTTSGRLNKPVGGQVWAWLQCQELLLSQCLVTAVKGFSHWESSVLSLPGVVILTLCVSTPFGAPKSPHSWLSWGFAGWFLTISVGFSNWNFEQNQGESTPLLKDMLKTYKIQSNKWNWWRSRYRCSSFILAGIHWSIRVH